MYYRLAASLAQRRYLIEAWAASESFRIVTGEALYRDKAMISRYTSQWTIGCGLCHSSKLTGKMRH